MATLEVTFTHPALSVTRTLTVTDAKLLEFSDLLRNLNYLPDENGDPLSRSAAVTTFADGMIQAAKDAYRRLKQLEATTAIVDEEIDA